MQLLIRPLNVLTVRAELVEAKVRSRRPDIKTSQGRINNWVLKNDYTQQQSADDMGLSEAYPMMSYHSDMTQRACNFIGYSNFWSMLLSMANLKPCSQQTGQPIDAINQGKSNRGG